MMADWAVSTVGDTMLVASTVPRVCPVENDRALRIAKLIRRHPRAGVRDVVESYCAVTVHLDPLRADVPAVVTDMEHAITATAIAAPAESTLPREHLVPVCYGGVDGPDLADVAAYAGVSEDEVVRRHAAALYRVYMLGFLPGFAYLGTVSPDIAMERRATPRSRVPAGAVGIAGSQTGIYPHSAPGGWQLIGRTPVRPFRPADDEPFLFRPGDRVRFVPAGPEVWADGRPDE